MTSGIVGRIVNYDYRAPYTGVRVPTRIYVHQAGAEVWGRDLRETKTLFENDMDEHLANHTTDDGVPDFNYMLTILWGNDEGYRIMDCFGHDEFDDLEGDKWKNSNPSIFSWNLRNGVFVPKTCIKESSTACRQGVAVVNAELNHIGDTASLADFLTTPPELARFRPFAEYDVDNNTYDHPQDAE